VHAATEPASVLAVMARNSHLGVGGNDTHGRESHGGRRRAGLGSPSSCHRLPRWYRRHRHCPRRRGHTPAAATVRDEAVPPACDAKGQIENQNLLSTSLPTGRIRIQSSEVRSKKEKRKQLRNQRGRPGRGATSRHEHHTQQPRARHGALEHHRAARVHRRAGATPAALLALHACARVCLAPRSAPQPPESPPGPSRTGSRRP
jgi:hypothetical protein